MRKLLTSVAIFVFTFLVFSASTVSAKVITDKNGTVAISKIETVNDDLFVGAQTVEIAGTINGDVFIAAQTVKVTGIINGNLHVGANTLDLNGTVKGNVYAGAQNILVSGSKIGGSLLVGASIVNVDNASTIGGSVIAGVGNLTLDTQIKRSVYAGTGTLTVGSGARIGKDLYYAAGNNQAHISSSAKIVGATYKTEAKNKQSTANITAAKKQLPAVLGAFKFGTTLISFIGALIVGLIYLKLFPKHLAQTSDIVNTAFWKSMGIGFLVTIAFVPGILILLVTIVGIPVAGLAIVLFILYSYLTKLVVGSAFGKCAVKKFNWKISNYGTFVIGLASIYIFKLIPVVGFFTGLVVFWVGLGALVLQLFAKSE